VSRTYDCRDVTQRATGIEQAAATVKRGQLVVMPTDTVYGVGADAFQPRAVDALLEAKGRGRDMPVPVLIGAPTALHGIATGLSDVAEALVEAFWPGGLTIVCHEQPSLTWDLGETRGTVAVRMPLHPVAIEVLRITGPMAVSSANRRGQPPGRTAAEAAEQLGDAVAVYLEGGPTIDDRPSTIVDVTRPVPRVLRIGAVDVDLLRQVAPGIEVGV
jgi:L-threonylcarbamoyladenylate synthase